MSYNKLLLPRRYTIIILSRPCSIFFFFARDIDVTQSPRRLVRSIPPYHYDI